MAQDQRMGGEQLLDGAAQRSRAFAVNHAHRGKTGEECIVQVLFEEIARLVSGAADELQLVWDGGAALPTFGPLPCAPLTVASPPSGERGRSTKPSALRGEGRVRGERKSVV